METAGRLIREASTIVVANQDKDQTKYAIPKNIAFTIFEAIANSMMIGTAAARLFGQEPLHRLSDYSTNPLFLFFSIVSLPIVVHHLYHFRLKGFIRKQQEDPDWSIPTDSKLHSFLLCLKKIYRNPKYLFIAETFVSPFLYSLPIFYRTITYLNNTTPYASYVLGAILGILVGTKTFLAEQCSTVETMPIHLPKPLNATFAGILKLNLYSFFLSALSAYEVYKFSFIFTTLCFTVSGSSTATLNIAANFLWGTLTPFIFVLTRDMLHSFDEKTMKENFKNEPAFNPNITSSFIADIGTISVTPIRFLTQKYFAKDLLLKIGYLFHVGLSFVVFTQPEQISQIATVFSNNATTATFQDPIMQLNILCVVMFLGTAILSGTLRCKLGSVPEYSDFQTEFLEATNHSAKMIQRIASSFSESRCGRALSTMGIGCARGLSAMSSPDNIARVLTTTPHPHNQMTAITSHAGQNPSSRF